MQAGIISTGYMYTAGKHDLNTKISRFLYWIDNSMHEMMKGGNSSNHSHQQQVDEMVTQKEGTVGESWYTLKKLRSNPKDGSKCHEVIQETKIEECKFFLNYCYNCKCQVDCEKGCGI